MRRGAVVLVAAAGLAAAAWTATGQAQAHDKRQERHTQVVFGGLGGYLGVTIEDLDGDVARELGLDGARGARVTHVREDSPAAEAGIESGDVIVSYAGERVLSVAQLRRLVRETPSGRSVALEVFRAGKRRTLQAEIGRTPGLLEGLRVPDFELPDLSELGEIPEGLEMFRGPRHGKDRALLFRHGRWMPGPRKLGIQYQEISGQLAAYFQVDGGRGVLVTGVDEDGPAGRAGLTAGDVILSFDGERIKDEGDLREAVAEAEPGGKVTLRVLRRGHEQELDVTLGGKRPKRIQGERT